MYYFITLMFKHLLHRKLSNLKFPNIYVPLGQNLGGKPDKNTGDEGAFSRTAKRMGGFLSRVFGSFFLLYSLCLWA